MIDETDRRLSAWVKSVVAAAEVSLASPGPAQTGRGISLYLMELGQLPPARGSNRPPLQLSLRYLVTAWADQPEDAHRLLGELAFAAMENEELEFDPQPLPVAAWAAFGTPPRPSFIISLPLRRERPQPEVALVAHPLTVRSGPIAPLFGLLLGPNDVPVARARVELTTLGLRAETDNGGHFLFATVPAIAQTWQLQVTARGRQFTAAVDGPAPESAPHVIRIDITSTPGS